MGGPTFGGVNFGVYFAPKIEQNPAGRVPTWPDPPPPGLAPPRVTKLEKLCEWDAGTCMLQWEVVEMTCPAQVDTKQFLQQSNDHHRTPAGGKHQDFSEQYSPEFGNSWPQKSLPPKSLEWLPVNFRPFCNPLFIFC